MKRGILSLYCKFTSRSATYTSTAVTSMSADANITVTNTSITNTIPKNTVTATDDILVSTFNNSRILKIPFEILLLIASNFSEYDMEHFSMTCRNFRQLSLDQEVWKAMYETRFMTDKDTALKYTANSLWKQNYLKKATPRLSAVDDMEISHMNTGYWNTMETESSIYGHVAKLNVVSWFKIIGSMESVPLGAYKVQWRMRVTSVGQHDSVFKFRISLKEIYDYAPITDDTYTMPYAFYKDPLIVDCGWLVITLPGRFVISNKQRFSKVYFSHDDISSSSKWGLEFDWVRLIPTSPTAKYNNSKLYVKRDDYNRMVFVKEDSILGNIYEFQD
ncbi:hypothetical protein J3Q64DRAFT_1699299 [Phycomyces blakesleeanus]|uniref:F-box domain-containing protein n=2 Tax=Phycomyces blakesleeanus TaxID=4837 RepID=A0A162NGZ1_PHYB8|nr:hypothetical protein PHYBLDRAFT_144593 [Phycomyces blakesleeanus NRRL 1555(-)]OAD74138.1 hypothetical protein PHYBLDRAFT_144593 [Phycomyces blakesleeanus NRRL 1555(-)]|eukprot:XP_018292178.1 hypothetical protein PHYBLDRAFT_144593 [Phycomyces blakesleeanus NRRL 1555(-)]